MILGYRQGNSELLYLGLGLPMWIFLMRFYLNQIHKISLSTDYLSIKIPLSKAKKINFKDIKDWETNYDARTNINSIVIKTNNKKTVITDLTDKKNFESLRHFLRINLKQF